MADNFDDNFNVDFDETPEQEIVEEDKKDKSGGVKPATVVLLALIFGFLAGIAGFFVTDTVYSNKGVLGGTLGERTVPNYNSQVTFDDIVDGNFSSIADALSESVVNINVTSKTTDPLTLWFGGSSEVRGLGTGMIMDTEGYILTNYHVVGGATTIKVAMQQNNEEKQYDATYIGGDQANDIAVIKIDAPNLRPVRFGDSDAVRRGDWVMAIGNPFGFENTVSIGVVSALNRSLPVDRNVTLRNTIQTDASINPGNSGGPLVNAKGEVIGINSAVFLGNSSSSMQASGIGFAIPSNKAFEIASQLRNGKSIEHPYIGVSFSPITDEVQEAQNLPVNSGAYIASIEQGGPADKAGIKPRDIITKIDGKAIDSKNTLDTIINTYKVGDTVSLTVQRLNGRSWQEQTLSLTIGNRPPTPER